MAKIVLACPDDPFRRSLERLLRQSGFSFFSCRTGSLASQRLQGERRAVLIFSFRLPDMPCASLIERFSSQIPLLLVDYPYLLESCGNAAVHTCPRPLNPDEFLCLLQQLCSQADQDFRKAHSRTEEEKRIIEQALAFIEKKKGCGREEALRILRSLSMSSSVSLPSAARLILSTLTRRDFP